MLLPKTWPFLLPEEGKLLTLTCTLIVGILMGGRVKTLMVVISSIKLSETFSLSGDEDSVLIWEVSVRGEIRGETRVEV